MHILLINRDYPHLSGPGPGRTALLERALRRHGHDTSLLTRRTQQDWQSGWSLLGQAQPLTTDPVKPLPRTNPGKPWRPSLLRLEQLSAQVDVATMAELRASHERHPFDAIFSTSNPITNGWAGMKISQELNVPHVLEMRDPWALNPIKRWPTPLHKIMASSAERRLIAKSSHHCLTTRAARDLHLHNNPDFPPERTHAVAHGYAGNPVLPDVLRTANGCIYICYTGSLYSPRSLDTLGKAVRLLNNTSSPVRHTFKIRLIGTPTKTVAQFAQRHGIQEHVEHFAWQSDRELMKTIQESHACYLTNPIIRHSPFISSKTYTYIRSGLPIIAELAVSEHLALVQKSERTLHCQPGCVKSMQQAMIQLSEWIGQEPTCPSLQELQTQSTQAQSAALLVDIVEQAANGESGTPRISACLSGVESTAESS